jgi:hypothetical protein
MRKLKATGQGEPDAPLPAEEVLRGEVASPSTRAPEMTATPNSPPAPVDQQAPPARAPPRLPWGQAASRAGPSY